MNIKIQVASVRDRKHLVAELWVDDLQIAEVSREQGRFEVEMYTTGVPIPLEELQSALTSAQEELMK